MNDGLIPRRYAKALLKFAEEQKSAERCYELMDTLVKSFAGNAELATVIANPFVDNKTKSGLLKTAAGATDNDNVYDDFIKLMLKNNRIDMMQSVANAYLTLYRKANNIHLVDITTAAPLGADEMKRLKSIIANHIKDGKVEYDESVDPELIGGFVVTIDNERLDASLKNELKQLRLKLLSK